jgi:hypothetical protein
MRFKAPDRKTQDTNVIKFAHVDHKKTKSSFERIHMIKFVVLFRDDFQLYEQQSTGTINVALDRQLDRYVYAGAIIHTYKPTTQSDKSLWPIAALRTDTFKKQRMFINAPK